MKYEQLVKAILANVGGKENIDSLTHCITRLRFKLKDEGRANTGALKSTPGVVSIVQRGGQYQVVIGSHVGEVHDELVKIGGLAEEAPVETPPDDGAVEKQKEKPKKLGPFNRLIDIVSGVFQPVLGIMCATGMIKGVLALLTAVDLLDPKGGTYTILYAVADCVFYYLPIFLGYTSAKKFGLTPFLGVAIGAAMVYPTIGASLNAEPLMVLFRGTAFESPVTMTFLGIPVIIPISTYASTVIPVILTTALAAPFERWLKTVIPGVVRNFVVPFFTLFIIIPLAFLAIGPVAAWLGNAIGAGIAGVYNFSPVVTGVVMGGLWQVLVILGLHWGIVPLAMANNAMYGQDPLLPLMLATTFAQSGAVAAVFAKTRDAQLKSICVPAFFSGLFGITEAAIYGVTLPRIKTFAVSCVIGAAGGGVMGYLNARRFIWGGLGIFEYPNYIDPNGAGSFIGAAVAVTALALALGFVVTYAVYREKPGSGNTIGDAAA